MRAGTREGAFGDLALGSGEGRGAAIGPGINLSAIAMPLRIRSLEAIGYAHHCPAQSALIEKISRVIIHE